MVMQDTEVHELFNGVRLEDDRGHQNRTGALYFGVELYLRRRSDPDSSAECKGILSNVLVQYGRCPMADQIHLVGILVEVATFARAESFESPEYYPIYTKSINLRLDILSKKSRDEPIISEMTLDQLLQMKQSIEDGINPIDGSLLADNIQLVI